MIDILEQSIPDQEARCFAILAFDFANLAVARLGHLPGS
jgi:hypothetical protein